MNFRVNHFGPKGKDVSYLFVVHVLFLGNTRSSISVSKSVRFPTEVTGRGKCFVRLIDP